MVYNSMKPANVFSYVMQKESYDCFNICCSNQAQTKLFLVFLVNCCQVCLSLCFKSNSVPFLCERLFWKLSPIDVRHDDNGAHHVEILKHSVLFCLLGTAFIQLTINVPNLLLEEVISASSNLLHKQEVKALEQMNYCYHFMRDWTRDIKMETPSSMTS